MEQLDVVVAVLIEPIRERMQQRRRYGTITIQKVVPLAQRRSGSEGGHKGFSGQAKLLCESRLAVRVVLVPSLPPIRLSLLNDQALEDVLKEVLPQTRKPASGGASCRLAARSANLG